jgi:hypothetical protein
MPAGSQYADVPDVIGSRHPEAVQARDQNNG